MIINSASWLRTSSKLTGKKLKIQLEILISRTPKTWNMVTSQSPVELLCCLLFLLHCLLYYGN